MTEVERAAAAPGGKAQAEIATERLLLRRLRPSDAGPVSLYCADARLARMTSSIPHPYPPGAAAGFIESNLSGRSDEIVWAIDATPSGGSELLGIVVFRPKTNEIGYWVGPPFWRTGYASEAVRAVVDQAFRERGEASLWAQVQVENDASAQVLAKAGFVETGTGSSFSVARGETVPTRRFEIDRAGWRAARGGGAA